MNQTRKYSDTSHPFKTRVEIKVITRYCLEEVTSMIEYTWVESSKISLYMFVSKIWEMVDKIKTDANRQLLVWKILKSSILANSIRNLFFIIKNKSSICPFLSSLSFSKFRIQNLMHFGRKYAETRPSCSQNLVTFSSIRYPELKKWRILIFLFKKIIYLDFLDLKKCFFGPNKSMKELKYWYF